MHSKINSHLVEFFITKVTISLILGPMASAVASSKISKHDRRREHVGKSLI